MKSTRTFLLLPLLAGLLLLPWGTVRVASALLLLLWIPGLGWARRLPAPGPGIALERLTFVLLAPWALIGIAGTLLGAVGAPPWLPVAGFALCGWFLLSRPSAPGRGFDDAGPESPWPLLLLFVAGALAALAPPELAPSSDVYAHVSAVRAILEEGRIFPVHEFYPPDQGTGADPRFGIAHMVYAVVAQLARVEPLSFWTRWAGPAALTVLAPMALLCRRVLRTPSGALVGLLAFVLAYGGTFYNPLRVAPYPLWIGLGMSVAALALLLDDRPMPDRRRPYLAALLVVGSGTLHALPVLLGGGMLVLAWIVAPARARRPFLRALGWLLLLGLPVMGLRLALSYADVNPIHQKLWQTLHWGGSLQTARPSYLLEWLPPVAWLSLAAAPWIARRRWSELPLRWTLVVSGLSLLWLCTPWVLGPSMQVLGFLPLRLVLLVWFPLLLGALAEALLASTRLRARVLLVVALLLLGFSGAQRLRSLHEPRPEELVQTPAWKTLLEQIEERGPHCVLADPFTMIMLRASSTSAVMAVPDGRSSPRDAQSIQRLRDAWAALSPHVGLAETVEILRRYGVSHVLLNHRPRQDRFSYEHPVSTAAFDAQREKFLGTPSLFRRVHEDDDLRLFEFLAAEDSIPPDGSWWSEATLPAPTQGEAWPLHDDFAIRDARVEREGDRLLVSGWLAYAGAGTPPDRMLALRVDRSPSVVVESLRPVEKPARKLLEFVRGVRYRQRWTARAADGRVPTYRLVPGRALPVRLELPLSPRLAPGHYALTLQISDWSVFMPVTPRDFLRDDDIYSGPVLGHFTLEPRERDHP